MSYGDGSDLMHIGCAWEETYKHEVRPGEVHFEWALSMCLFLSCEKKEGHCATCCT